MGDADLAALRFDQLFDDRQADPRAAGLARSRLVSTIESLEQTRQFVRVDRAASVGDRDLHAVGRTMRVDRNLASGGRISARIVDQVGQDLSQLSSVPKNRIAERFHFGGDSDFLLLETKNKELDRVQHEPVHANFFDADVGLGRIGPREADQVVDTR